MADVSPCFPSCWMGLPCLWAVVSTCLPLISLCQACAGRCFHLSPFVSLPPYRKPLNVRWPCLEDSCVGWQTLIIPEGQLPHTTLTTIGLANGCFYIQVFRIECGRRCSSGSLESGRVTSTIFCGNTFISCGPTPRNPYSGPAASWRAKEPVAC